jgi:predicted membrane protein
MPYFWFINYKFEMEEIKMNQIIEKNQGRSRAVIGIILLFIGVALIANQFNIIPFQIRDLLFTWQSILIIVGVVMLSRKENNFTGFILIGVGVFFLIPHMINLPFEYRGLFWPVFFVLMGILLIFRSTNIFGGLGGTHIEHGFSEDYIDDLNIFGGHNRKINSMSFRGGKITSAFGGGTYDLTSAQLAPGTNVLDQITIFGGSKLIVPNEWDIKIEVVAIFGGFSDKRGKLPIQTSVSEKRLVIKGVAIFGGGEIISY